MTTGIKSPRDSNGWQLDTSLIDLIPRRTDSINYFTSQFPSRNPTIPQHPFISIMGVLLPADSNHWVTGTDASCATHPFFFTPPEFFDGPLPSNLEFQLCPSSNVIGLSSSIILTTWRIFWHLSCLQPLLATSSATSIVPQPEDSTNWIPYY